MAMVSAQFPKILQPASVYEQIRFGYKSAPSVYDKIFSEASTNLAEVKELNLIGLGPYMPWDAEGGEMTIDQGYEGYEWSYRPKFYGLKFAITYYLLKTQQYNLVQNLARSLGRSAKVTIERLAHAVFNLGDTVVGGDGVPLFSNNHPVFGDETASNIISGDLTPDTLYAAMVHFDTLTDERGNPILMEPKILLVPKYLMRVVHEILKSEKVPYSADNTANYLFGANLTIISSPYLTSDADWFLIAGKDDNALKAYWLEKPQVRHYEDNPTLSVIYQGFFAVAFGWSDWRGIVKGVAA